MFSRNYNKNDTSTDEKYMHFLASQPVKALELLIDRYSFLVKTVASGILGSLNTQDIEECISDVFVKLWKNADRFDMSKGSLKSYLISITRYTAIDYCRKKMSIEQFPLEEQALHSNFETELQAINNINYEIVRNAIDSLEATDKKIFIKRFYEYQKINEIAASLELAEKYVENRLYRGKKILEKNLIKMGVMI